jgi:acyl-CoA reductase-like NAD-dependent aldehyde dehydrogenase
LTSLQPTARSTSAGRETAVRKYPDVRQFIADNGLPAGRISWRSSILRVESPPERASAGMVGANVGVPVPREPFSFGGWNESKFGSGGITGRGSIEFWTKAKKITTKRAK